MLLLQRHCFPIQLDSYFSHAHSSTLPTPDKQMRQKKAILTYIFDDFIDYLQYDMNFETNLP